MVDNPPTMPPINALTNSKAIEGKPPNNWPILDDRFDLLPISRTRATKNQRMKMARNPSQNRLMPLGHAIKPPTIHNSENIHQGPKGDTKPANNAIKITEIQKGFREALFFILICRFYEDRQ